MKKNGRIWILAICIMLLAWVLAACVDSTPQLEAQQTGFEPAISQQQMPELFEQSPQPEADGTVSIQPSQLQSSAATTAQPMPELIPKQALVTISIDCRNATQADVPGAPEDGWIFDKCEVELQDGDTVWDVLNRICRKNGIAVCKSGSGSSIFVKSIGGVGSVSAQSGWMYSVNGTYVNTGAGNCTINSGDTICWKYTMDGGDDI